MFGQRTTPWWKKDNVCIKREVLEEDDEETRNFDIQISGNTNFHMQVLVRSNLQKSYILIRSISA